MANLSLTNVVNVSVSATNSGVGAYNTSNLAIFTREAAGSSFGTLGYKIYVSSDAVATDFGSSSVTYKMANAIFSQQPNILANNGYLVIFPMIGSETIDVAISRCQGLVEFFGVMCAEISAQTDLLNAAAVMQPLNRCAFFVSRTAGDVAPGGMLDLLRTGNFSHTRGLYYGAGSTTDALIMMASYAGRALSTNFDGSLTTQTMHLKDLKGVQPDTTIDQTLLGQCQAAGVDVYASLMGIPKVFTSGANGFFDDIYNQLWFIGALRVAGFNALAQASTKVPQTEEGMSALKAAYRQVCEQAVTNQYAAPGAWNSSTTFGNQANFLQNISQRGYYIYSMPISQQSPSSRASRSAPLVQIALKEAGAIHSTSVIVNINA